MKRKHVFIVLIAVIALASLILLIILKPQGPYTPISINQVLNAKIPNLADSGDNLVQLKNGEIDGVYESDGVGRWNMKLDTSFVVYDDFNNDAKQDIATVLGASGGGSGYFTYLVIFTDDKGIPKYMVSKELGDRIKLKSISYKDGYFYADMITQGPDEGLCCGTLHKIFKYKIEKGLLTEVLD